MPKTLNKFTSQTTKHYYAKTSCQLSNDFLFSNVSKEVVKRFYQALIPVKPLEWTKFHYRTISLLPLVSSIIEKSIYFQIEDYLNKKKLIYMYQLGFRTNHSSDYCLAQLTDFVLTAMDKQMHTGMIADLQKAFDTLGH